MSAMAANGYNLSALLSAYELKFCCRACCVEEKEISYTLKSVSHQCAHDVLLCKAKGPNIWRPVAKRPLFPNPKRYVVCWHFEEGSGCTQHKNRCSYARSEEEAAVWNFEKQGGLDHRQLCHLVAPSEKQPDEPQKNGPLADISAILDVKVVCDFCAVKEKEITYTVQSIVHKCGQNRLLAKGKGGSHWRPISERPNGEHCGPNVVYKVCIYFVEDSGCKHGSGCTFAKSYEEAAVWNFVKEKKINLGKLIKLVSESESALTPECAAKTMLQQFSGEFMELCNECFCERPQKISRKRWNDKCTADAAHSWNPVLVHYLSEKSQKQVYSQVRPLPQNCQFKYCSHVRDGKPCWHQADHCQSAQSEVEMAVWKAEHSGLSVRPLLLQQSPSQQTELRPASMYCKVCLITLYSSESFDKHCASLEHAQLLAVDTTTRWRKRQPPHNRRAEFWLCDRPKTCEYGINCPKAHSVEELQEWMMRVAEEKEIRQNIDAQGLMNYSEKLLEEYRRTSNEVYIMSEQVDDVLISCKEDLTVACETPNKTLTWNFRIATERQLVHVALLKQEPGASFSLGESSSDCCIYSAGKDFLTEDRTYAITVSFTSTNPGLYEQWFVLDFAIRPVLLRKIRVRVGQQSPEETEQPSSSDGVTFQGAERWHRGNRVIIPCSSRTEEQEELLKKYKPPQVSLDYKSSQSSQLPLTKDNYKEKMHQFLYSEEHAEDKVVSGLNVCGEIKTTNNIFSTLSGPMMASPGELFCSVSIPCNLSVASPEGMALKRSVRSGLIAPLTSNGPNSKVYEATILPLKKGQNTIYLQMSKQCCADLALKANESHQMEVQFQLDRSSFCNMHKAVDLLPDTKRVLPDLQNCGIPVSKVKHEKTNDKQQAAIDFITGESTVKKFVAPLLIYGPFGTGKTYTLATAAAELCKNPDNKVLICTHTNSSADLYVRDHFHPLMSKKNHGLRPIRIKANKQSAMGATDPITLKYCFRSYNGERFLPPNKAVLDCHNIVITTTTMARPFHGLKLKEGYFTHILIDEASQMLECEALMALTLAGPNTRVALAGDHMQMGPKLFSVENHQRSDYTLLTRLFHYYQDKECDAALHSRLIFNENYRSTKEIVDFVSTHFYVGKNDVIKATDRVPPPADGHALKFFHVRGECVLDTGSMSWYNNDESAQVVKVVKDILEQWPETWGPKDPNSICIMSEGAQVWKIRGALSRKGVKDVHVENLANVQGKQFRAVILTAVQTRDSLETAHLPGLELFNDVRVLNTAVTRAQSQVVVVGDAAALCCFGNCSKVWKSYIDHCISNESAAPKSFTKDFFERDVMETAKFQKSQNVAENNTLSDAILQELQEEHENMEREYGEEEDTVESEDMIHQPSVLHNGTEVNRDVMELCRKFPDMFLQGKLVRETFKTGHVIPFGNTNQCISIKGRENLGKTFTGDEVVIQISEAPRVVCVTREDELARELVCTLQDEDYSRPRQKFDYEHIRRTMVPLSKAETKIVILINKKMHNYIPVWKQINKKWEFATYERLDVNLRQNNVFIVRVINWKDTCWFPLGKIIGILPVTGLSNQLRILNTEFNIPDNTWNSRGELLGADEDVKQRQNLTKLTTFTVDPDAAKDLDDAISVREMGSQYELGIHIADVASIVTPGSKLDADARKKGSTYYSSGQKPIHMFPQDFSTDVFSLLPNQVRRVVSLIFKVEKETHKIVGKPVFQLSKIKSDRQLSYDEAEVIITEKYQDSPKFDEVEDCVAVAYCFAKAQRKVRLVDWQYYQLDDDRLPGRRKAHLMIEELSVLFNKHAAETLINSEKTRFSTPLRCQEKPNPEKIEEFKEDYEALIPFSFHVRHKVDHDELPPKYENFRILTEMWKEIQSAANAGDVDKMVDLIAADDVHPLLQQVIYHFKKALNKAYFTCSNPTNKAKVGHYSLNLMSYTQASSPIRRYMDLILQRLLHSVICHKGVQYKKADITNLCRELEDKLKKAKNFEQKSEQIVYAVGIKKQSAPKFAFVVHADAKEDGFLVSFPFNKNAFGMRLSVMYRDLQLEDQPDCDEENHSHQISLQWKRRIYTTDTMKPYHEVNMMADGGHYIELPMSAWKSTVEAVAEGDLDEARSLILKAHEEQLANQIVKQPSQSNTSICAPEKQVTSMEQSEHWVDINLQLQPGDMLRVQLTSQINRGCFAGVIQLVHIKPKFEICVDHAHNPITCFTKSADRSAKPQYRDTEEYVEIWKPLCDMESAHGAVHDSDGITIENLEINFTQKKKGVLSGRFFLPVHWIEEWAIQFNLSKCLLCIRKRGLKLPPNWEHSATVDPPDFTWVAHGVTNAIEVQGNIGTTVKFYINHLPMDNIPDCVFKKNTVFTVEIIPKLPPDVRKETAVVNVPRASDLVQAIALGKYNPTMVKKDVRIVQEDPTNGRLVGLNESQTKALSKALSNDLTLIQGPPGTGKTIVGVHMLFHFLEQNKRSPMKMDNTKEKKKQVILYCGPSNKSVDVVAEYLVKFADQLKPLRVYGKQVEALDYPLPDSNLQFSKKHRQDKAKQELRSITLHHRMRQDQNKFSAEIRFFDQRIQRKDKLSVEEVKKYQKLLSDAREYELQRHEIILCTCTVSSTPSLTSNVNARQILIDECAMATEPQTMVPLVCNQPEKIVLIGDHKQLRPIVKEQSVKKLGMANSLFERIYALFGKCTVMLDTQYRMHKDICRFPSKAYYDNKLNTAVERGISVLRVGKKTMPVVFGHIKGKTISLTVSTARGNENSKANLEERNKVVDIAHKLVKEAKIKQQDIVILSPYNAQVSEIKDELKKKAMEKITVTTITKSQGSEWQYVLISTVCSLPKEEILLQPDGKFLSKHLGFVMDPNQINVAITRAKEGLCIIGDQELLRCSHTWEFLLNDYTEHSAVAEADQISVHSPTKDPRRPLR
ncbi:unnamed protein product [Ophioblennius macclurei]